MARPVDDSHAERGRQLAEWRARYPEAYGFALEWDDEVGVFIPVTRVGETPLCGARLRNGLSCPHRAGIRTAHEGVGRCWRHDSRVERAAGAWAVAHKIAQVMEISPWEALLLAVKRAAAWAAFYDEMMGTAPHDDALRPGGSHYEWVEAAERVNDKLARWSKMAVDAGVAKILVERAQTEGAQIARVLNMALSRADLDETTDHRVRAALREVLSEVARDESLVIESSSPSDDS